MKMYLSLIMYSLLPALTYGQVRVSPQGLEAEIFNNVKLKVSPVVHRAGLSDLFVSPVQNLFEMGTYSISKKTGITFGIKEDQLTKFQSIGSLRSNQKEWFNFIKSVVVGNQVMPQANLSSLVELSRSQYAQFNAFMGRMENNDEYVQKSLNHMLQMKEIPSRVTRENVKGPIDRLMKKANMGNWGNLLMADRAIQSYCFSYQLIAEKIKQKELESIQKVLIPKIDFLRDVAIYQPVGNHMVRIGAALGTCALAFTSYPPILNEKSPEEYKKQINDWWKIANTSMSIGLSYLTGDGFNIEGQIYSNYADEVLFPFIRYALDFFGDCALLRNKKMINYFKYMTASYWKFFGYQSWKDGHPSSLSYMPLMIGKGIPLSGQTKAAFDEIALKSIPYSHSVEAFLYSDPFDEVREMDFQSLFSENFIFAENGIAFFQTKKGPNNWRVSVVGAQKGHSGHEHINGTGDFLVAMDDQNVSRNATYPPGGSKDDSMLDYSLPHLSNGIGGSKELTSKKQTKALGAFDSNGFSGSAIQSVLPKRTETRHFHWVRNGQYALVTDWTESKFENNEYVFRFNSMGGPVKNGFKILDSMNSYVRFQSLSPTDESISLGRHSNWHGNEQHHSILERKSKGRKTLLSTVVSVDKGIPIQIIEKSFQDNKFSATIMTQDGDEDWVIGSRDSELVSVKDEFRNMKLEGKLALAVGMKDMYPQSLALIQARYFQLNDLEMSMPVPVDINFVVKGSLQMLTLQGLVGLPDLNEWHINISHPSMRKWVILYNGNEIEKKFYKSGEREFLKIPLKGQGMLSIGGKDAGYFFDYPLPVDASTDEEYFLALQNPSMIQYLSTMPDHMFKESLLVIMSDENRSEQLKREILSHAMPMFYQSFLDRLSKMTGEKISPDDIDQVMGTLWLIGYGQVKRVNVELDWQTGDSQVTTGIDYNFNTHSINKGRQVSEAHLHLNSKKISASIQRISPLASVGGKWQDYVKDPGVTYDLGVNYKTDSNQQVSVFARSTTYNDGVLKDEKFDGRDITGREARIYLQGAKSFLGLNYMDIDGKKTSKLDYRKDSTSVSAQLTPSDSAYSLSFTRPKLGGSGELNKDMAQIGAYAVIGDKHWSITVPVQIQIRDGKISSLSSATYSSRRLLVQTKIYNNYDRYNGIDISTRYMGGGFNLDVFRNLGRNKTPEWGLNYSTAKGSSVYIRIDEKNFDVRAIGAQIRRRYNQSTLRVGTEVKFDNRQIKSIAGQIDYMGGSSMRIWGQYLLAMNNASSGFDTNLNLGMSIRLGAKK